MPGPAPGFPTLARRSLVIAALTMGVQNGVVMAFGVLYFPLVREFAGGRGVVAAVQSAVVLLGGLGAPLAGAALDRWGPRRLFQAGASLAAAGLVLASHARTLPLLALTYGVVAGAGLSLLSSSANMVVVAQWFPARRGRAIALADLGTPLGAFALVPLTEVVVARFGWRAALQFLASLLLVLVLPANGAQRLPAEPAALGVEGDRRALAAALATPVFWWLAALRCFTGIGFTLVNVHVVTMAIEAGIQPLRAAAALGAVAVVSVAGRLAIGWLLDRAGPAVACTAGFTSALLGIGCVALLGLTRAPGWLGGYVLCYGLAQGSGGIVATATATRAFHGPAIGLLTGWIAVASGPGEGFGAWAGGAVYDWTGGYQPALGLAALALVAGVTAIWQAERATVGRESRRAP